MHTLEKYLFKSSNMSKSLCMAVLLTVVLNMAYTQNSIKAKGSDTITIQPSFSNLDEIIITGSREIQRRTEVPIAVSVISKAMINDTKATRLDMLINKVPGVFMVDLGNEQ